MSRERPLNIICINSDYSTTQMLSQEKPEELKKLSPYPKRKEEGGLRTKGYHKKSYQDKPLVSIITVVKNDEKHLEQTIKSVINQTYSNIEYIIIDGASNKGTLEIIKNYEDKIEYWLSEADNGIYDAMNKGVDISTGEWINFMNAGDRFYENNIIEKIFLGKNCNVDFIYGDCKIEYDLGFSRIQKAGEIKNLWKGMICSHQSLFSRGYILKKCKFNINNRNGADFEFLFTCYMNKFKFRNVHFPIATVSAGGLSDTDRVRSILDWWSVIKKFSSNIKVNVYYSILFCDTIIRLGIKKIFPKQIYKFLLKKKYG